MIQRIQTIFLLLTVGAFGALFEFPFATSDQITAQFLSDKVFDITDHPVLLGLAIGGGILALVDIFLFKNRKLQINIGYLIILLALLLPALAFFLFKDESSKTDITVHIFDHFGIYLPVAAVLFTSIANYFVRKDDKLVKSMDRLR